MCPTGLDLTYADAVLPDEAKWAPGPAHAQGSGARLEGYPGVVGPPGLGGTGPQPGHQEVPVADGGHVWSTTLQWSASLAVAEESLARWAQAAEATLEVVALVGAGLGQLQALVDIWGEQGQAGCPGGSGLCCSAWLRPSLLPSSLSQNPAASPPAHQPATKPSLSAPPASSPVPGSKSSQRFPSPPALSPNPRSLNAPPFSLQAHSWQSFSETHPPLTTLLPLLGPQGR